MVTVEAQAIRATDNEAIWRIQELLHRVEPDVGEVPDLGFRRFKLVLPPNHPRWARSWQQLWKRAQDAERDRNGNFKRSQICGALYSLEFPEDLDTDTKLDLLERFAGEAFVNGFGVAALIGVNGRGFLAVCRRPFLANGKGFGTVHPDITATSWAAEKLTERWTNFLAAESHRKETPPSLQDSDGMESLIAEIRGKLKDWEEAPGPGPCPDEDLQAAEGAFRAEFGRDFPDGYKRLLALSNGVYFDGMTIWPATPEDGFEETILEANRDLHDTFSKDFLYFGQNGEELFVLDLRTNRFVAIEFVGKPVWAEFADADEMIRFMLARNLRG